MIKLYHLLLGMLIGYLSWGHNLTLTILSLSLFFSYLLVEKRWDTFLFALGYYAIATRGLLFGVEIYYDHIGYAFLIWAIVAFLSSSVWVLIWSKSFKNRLLLFPLVLLLTIAPPIGFISWVNPLPSIAVILPSLGFLSLFMEIVFIYFLAILLKKSKFKSYHFGMIIGLFLFIIHFYYPPSLQEYKEIKSIKSDIEYFPMTFDRSKEYKVLKAFFNKVQSSSYLNILLPENALGNYSNIQSMLWQNLDKNKTVFAGATIYNNCYTKNINVLLQVEHNVTKILYKQRVPVLIEMWKPFTYRGTEATIYKQPIIRLKEKNVGVFICYEQLLTYPYLQTFLYNPDMLVGVSNLYWAKGTNIKRIQEETMALWSILFGVPLSFSVNG